MFYKGEEVILMNLARVGDFFHLLGLLSSDFFHLLGLLLSEFIIGMMNTLKAFFTFISLLIAWVFFGTLNKYECVH